MERETADFSIPVQIARIVIRHYAVNGTLDGLPAIPELDMPPAGCFVSMKKAGELRGCIGTIAPTRATLSDEIVRNAVAASTSDPRFEPVTVGEIDDLDVSVDVLGPSEPVVSRSELDPKVYGVIVTHGYRRGLLLPDLEGVDSVEVQLAIACRKGGIAPDESYRIERFKVTRFT